MRYNLTSPCGNCPFRSDKRFPLHRGRIEEITMDGHEFACHKTVDYSDPDDDGDYQWKSEDTSHCAGLLILLEKEEQPHQMMRIAERFGDYDHTKLNMDAPVYDTIEDCIEAVAIE